MDVFLLENEKVTVAKTNVLSWEVENAISQGIIKVVHIPNAGATPPAPKTRSNYKAEIAANPSSSFFPQARKTSADRNPVEFLLSLHALQHLLDDVRWMPFLSPERLRQDKHHIARKFLSRSNWFASKNDHLLLCLASIAFLAG
ncbi:hypothetical protein LOK49_LG11G00774 [Camellia lanceoleosa]|uniref:Uncharacterized protein n=1 Tax=Camellia lanceoleosa TaxID=1840588 RepID=A0ACC0FZ96_9ERIC|nr:hypothetical protein LOK49_LG11G00774 [Camellia lanceoleosa]